MTYLFLDTSSNTLILSLIKEDKIIDKIIMESLKEHSIYAVEKLDEILKNNNLTPNDVDKIFVVNGPGSFTGVRIGVTIAKTYAYCLKKDIVPISSLKMKILEYKNYDNYVSVMKDKRDLVYCGIYDKKYKTISEELITTEQLQNRLENLDEEYITIILDITPIKAITIIFIVFCVMNVLSEFFIPTSIILLIILGK